MIKKNYCKTVEFERVCGKEVKGHGLCYNHYYLFRKYGSPTFRIKAPQGSRSKDPLYKAWLHMHERCYNPNDKRYASYGNRGITVCDRWNRNVVGWIGFDNFKKDMGDKPADTYISGKPKYSLNRINNDIGYSPENCVWATMCEQNSNTTKSNITPGVCFDKSRNKWKARLQVDKKDVVNKRFNTYQEAVTARLKAVRTYLSKETI